MDSFKPEFEERFQYGAVKESLEKGEANVGLWTDANVSLDEVTRVFKEKYKIVGQRFVSAGPEDYAFIAFVVARSLLWEFAKEFIGETGRILAHRLFKKKDAPREVEIVLYTTDREKLFHIHANGESKLLQQLTNLEKELSDSKGEQFQKN